jgi:hypothetical protein
VLKLSRGGAEKSVAQRLSSLKAVLDKADVVLAMDDEMQAQQAQQTQQVRQQDAAPTEVAEAGAPNAAGVPRPLTRSDTGNLECGSGSLPPGIGSSGRMASTASQEPESPLAAAAAAGGAIAASVYVSAAPSAQLDAADLAADVAADVAATVLLEPLPDGAVQLSILLPAAAEQEGGAEAEQEGGAEAEVDEESEASDGELPPELAGGSACMGGGCGSSPL